jgi:hypothetical protein
VNSRAAIRYDRFLEHNHFLKFWYCLAPIPCIVYSIDNDDRTDRTYQLIKYFQFDKVMRGQPGHKARPAPIHEHAPPLLRPGKARSFPAVTVSFCFACLGMAG